MSKSAKRAALRALSHTASRSTNHCTNSAPEKHLLRTALVEAVVVTAPAAPLALAPGSEWSRTIPLLWISSHMRCNCTAQTQCVSETESANHKTKGKNKSYHLSIGAFGVDCIERVGVCRRVGAQLLVLHVQRLTRFEQKCELFAQTLFFLSAQRTKTRSRQHKATQRKTKKTKRKVYRAARN